MLSSCVFEIIRAAPLHCVHFFPHHQIKSAGNKNIVTLNADCKRLKETKTKLRGFSPQVNYTD
jgi:hypothetical protein